MLDHDFHEDFHHHPPSHLAAVWAAFFVAFAGTGALALGSIGLAVTGGFPLDQQAAPTQIATDDHAAPLAAFASAEDMRLPVSAAVSDDEPAPQIVQTSDRLDAAASDTDIGDEMDVSADLGDQDADIPATDDDESSLDADSLAERARALEATAPDGA